MRGFAADFVFRKMSGPFAAWLKPSPDTGRGVGQLASGGRPPGLSIFGPSEAESLHPKCALANLFMCRYQRFDAGLYAQRASGGNIAMFFPGPTTSKRNKASPQETTVVRDRLHIARTAVRLLGCGRAQAGRRGFPADNCGQSRPFVRSVCSRAMEAAS